MHNKLFKNKKTILKFTISLFILDILMAYFYWGIEPHETISGVLCGLGFGFSLLFFSLKKPIS